MALDEVADRLYALPPEDFTRARDAAAKDEPSLKRDLAALRRPTVAAWAVNVLAREDAATLDELLSLGPELAAAQSAGEGDRLRALSQQRRGLLRTVTARAVELAGRDLTAAARGEVEATLEAALADPPSADAVRSGRLVRALSFVGFGGVDLEGAVAAPGVGPASKTPRHTGSTRVEAANDVVGGQKTKQKTPGTQTPKAPAATPSTAKALKIAAAKIRELESQALEAAGRLDDAVRSLDAVRHAQEESAAALRLADQVVVDAEHALAAARQEQEDAMAAHDQATARTTGAERTVEEEQTSAEQARAALDRHRRATSD